MDAKQATLKKAQIVIPNELKSLSKSDVTFFLEKVPSLMQNGDATEFYKLFELYLDGILTKYEFYELVSPLLAQNTDEGSRSL